MKKEDEKGANQTPPMTDPTPPCEQCGSNKNVSYCIEPYAEDICGKTIWMWLCKKCYDDNCGDI